MSDDKLFNIISFFKKWKADFEKVIKVTVSDSIGYSEFLDSEFAIRHLGLPSPREKAEWARDEYRALIVFHRGFISTCKKSGILRRYLQKERSFQDFNYIGEGLSEWQPAADPLPHEVVEVARKFSLFLEKRIGLTKRRISKDTRLITHRRIRIPVKVAVVLLRALHFCSGDRTALEYFRKLILPRGELDILVQEITASMQRKIFSTIERDFEIDKKNRKKYKSPRVIHKLNRTLFEKKEEYGRVKGFELIWLPFKHRGDNGGSTQWANHLKDHLIKLILSEGEPKIRKSLQGLKRKKKKLILDIELRNAEMMVTTVLDS
jgi:hypothetical protein